jgi:hypothetical protein
MDTLKMPSRFTCNYTLTGNNIQFLTALTTGMPKLPAESFPCSQKLPKKEIYQEEPLGIIALEK